jgi:hypothetical protein
MGRGVITVRQNEAARFISPTKTPEYLAAGLPVVSTPIQDVIRPYGTLGFVFIGRDHKQFLHGIEQQLREGRPPAWQSEVRVFLNQQSWDKTWLFRNFRADVITSNSPKHKD